MKSLKKVAVIGALLSTMNFAKADQKEVEFGPTDYEGGQIDKIELVNGHLLVRSNGQMSGIEMPYAYTGTNTQNFASHAFAQGGATNVNQYVHAGDGKIYMTFNHTNGVYKTQILDRPEIEGVTCDVTEEDPVTHEKKVVEYAIKEADTTNDPIAKAMAEGRAVDFTKTIDGIDYTVTDDNYGTHVITNGVVIPTASYVNQTRGKRKDDLVVMKDSNGSTHAYILAEGIVASGMDGVLSENAISISKEGDKLAITTQDGKKKLYKVNGSFVSEESVVSSLSGSDPIKSFVVSKDGKTMYYATAKKLGYKTIGQ